MKRERICNTKKLIIIAPNDNFVHYFTESGQEMLKQLNILTGIQFTSPTGIIGQYNHGLSTF